MIKPAKISVVWLVPALIEGSGGHRTILNHAFAMRRAGYRVTLCVETVAPRYRANPERLIERLYGFKFDEVRLGWQQLPASDAVIATSWVSAYYANQSNAKTRVYFVQDWEALFHPTDARSVYAEETYQLGLTHITIGRWLAHKLGAECGASAAYFDFGANLDVYRPEPQALPAKPTVCFIHQPDKPRRGSDLGLKALRWLQEKRPDVSIVLYGSDYDGPGNLRHENRGLVRPEDCAKIYQSSTVGLSLSLTNPSRIPFEMMACGLPVVELHRSSSIWDFPQEAMLLAKGSPEAVGSALLSVLDDVEKQREMSNAGLSFMVSRDEGKETQQFLAHFETLLEGKALPPLPDIPAYRNAPVDFAGRMLPPVATENYTYKQLLKVWVKKQAVKFAYKLKTR